MILTRKPDDTAALSNAADAGPIPGAEEPSLEAELLDAGVAPRDLAAVREVFRRRAEAESDRRVRDLLSYIFPAIDGTSAGVALIRAFSESDLSLSDDARRLGITKQSLAESCEAMRKRVMKAHAITDPDAAGTCV